VIDDTVMAASSRILQNRVDAYGVSEPVIQRKGIDQVLVELPAVQGPGTRRAPSSRTPRCSSSSPSPGFEATAIRPTIGMTGSSTRTTRAKETVSLLDRREGDVPVDQEKFFSDPANYDVIVSGQPAQDAVYPGDLCLLPPDRRFVSLGLDKEGTQNSPITPGNPHRRYPASSFWDKKIISAPAITHPHRGWVRDRSRVASPTSWRPRIWPTSSSPAALPVPLKELEITTVDATLGRGAVHQTETAGLIGLILVIAFMLIFSTGSLVCWPA